MFKTEDPSDDRHTRVELAQSGELGSADAFAPLNTPSSVAYDPAEHPRAIGTTRGAIEDTTIILPTLVRIEANLKQRGVDAAAIDVWNPAPALIIEMEYVELQIRRRGVDLTNILVEMLTQSDDAGTSLAAMQMLSALDEHERIAREYFAPALERRAGLSNSVVHRNFCIRYLQSVGKENVRDIVAMFDVNELSADAPAQKELAAALTLLRGPVGAAEDVIRWLNGARGEGPTGEDSDLRTKLQRLLVATFEAINAERPGVIGQALSKHLGEVYSTAKDEYAKEILELLAKHNRPAAVAAVERIIADTSDDSFAWRLKRFWSMRDLGTTSVCLPQHRSSRVAQLLFEEQDPLVAGIATWMLLNETGADGRRLLATTIVGLAREQSTCRPLGILSMLHTLGFDCREVFESLIRMDFHDGSLKDTLLDCAQTPLCTLRKTNGKVTFHFDQPVFVSPARAIVQCLGLERIREWSCGKDGATAIVVKNARGIDEAASTNIARSQDGVSNTNRPSLREALSAKILLRTRPDLLRMSEELGGMRAPPKERNLEGK